MPFNLETPVTPVLTGVTRFSGWYIPEISAHPELILTAHGGATVGLVGGLPRPDVVPYFPQHPRAILCGFQGDLVCTLPPDAQAEITIVDRSDPAKPIELYRRPYMVKETFQKFARTRTFDLFRILRCPKCREALSPSTPDIACTACRKKFPLVNQVPHFLEELGTPAIRFTEENPTHRYSDAVLEILRAQAGGLLLDFGSGNTPSDLVSPNTVYLDALQYRNTDVVCTTVRLPFADQTFDAIISQSVFEHIPDPWGTARELHRILKPGGTVFVDTAFMQPLHADPSHYFNMTLHGLRRIMSPFKEISSGSLSHQRPDSSLIMQLDSLIPHVRPGRWRNRLEQWRQDLQTDQLSFIDDVTDLGVELLAAGVYFKGTRV